MMLKQHWDLVCSDSICSAFKDEFKWINIPLVVLSLEPGNSGVRESFLSDFQWGEERQKILCELKQERTLGDPVTISENKMVSDLEICDRRVQKIKK